MPRMAARNLQSILLLAWTVHSVLAAPAASASRSACQQVSDSNPLAGCKSGTILVSPSHPEAHYQTVQSALDSLDDSSAATLLILSGTYNEQIEITRSGAVTLLGETGDSSAQADNTVTVVHKAANVNGRYPNNDHTATLYIHPDSYNHNVRAYNIDFRNEYAEYGVAPSLAIAVDNANAGLYNVGLYSYQDTLYVGKKANGYFHHNEIAGQTDFLYAFISDSLLSLRGCGGAITAWKGTNTTFTNKYGVYISNSRVQAANSTIAAEYKGKCALGRPWNDLHRSVFMNTYFDATVNGGTYKGWSAWPGNTFMAEWKSYGPGYNDKVARANDLTRVLDDEQVKPYKEPQDVFITEEGTADVSWIDSDA